MKTTGLNNSVRDQIFNMKKKFTCLYKMSSDFNMQSDTDEGARAGNLQFSDKSNRSSINPVPVRKVQSKGEKSSGSKSKIRPSKKLQLESHKQRLERFSHKREEKVSKLSEEFQQLEMKECTFTPKINSPQTRRSVDQFIKDQSSFATKLKNKLETLIDKNNELPSDVSFVPTINKASQRIALMNRSKNNKSYTLCGNSKSTNLSNYISRISKDKDLAKKNTYAGNSLDNLKLKGKEETIVPISYTSDSKIILHKNLELKNQLSSGTKQGCLYPNDEKMDSLANCKRSEARKKTNQTIENIPTTHDSKKSFTPNTSKGKSPQNSNLRKHSINQKSIKILSSSFILEFNTIFSGLSGKLEITYSMYIELLSKMSFVLKTSDKEYALRSWNALSQSKAFVPKKRLLSFLLKVMNFKQGNEHREYFHLYNNRVNATLRSSLNPSSPKIDSPSFSPQLSKRSIKLAQAQKAKRARDFLYKERQNIKQKVNRIKHQNHQKEIDECSFQPMINSLKLRKSDDSIKDCWDNLTKSRRQSVHRALTLYSLSMDKQQRIKRKRKEARVNEMIKTKTECPFNPLVRSPILKDKKFVPDNKGISQAVNRLAQAREDRTNKKAQLTRGYTFSETSDSFKFDLPKKKCLSPALVRSDTKIFKEFSVNLTNMSESSEEISDSD